MPIIKIELTKKEKFDNNDIIVFKNGIVYDLNKLETRKGIYVDMI